MLLLNVVIMKKKKGDNLIFEIFLVAIVAVFSVLILNVVFGMPHSGECIWSNRGFAVLFGVAIVQMALQTVCFRIKVSANFLMRCGVVLAMVYVLGILTGTVVMREIGFDATLVPMWGDVGVAFSYWIALVAWISSKILLKNTL